LLVTTQIPLSIVQGYIRKLVVEVPITKIFSQPVQITIEDLHIIVKSSEKYDRNFVKRVILGQKLVAVEELLNKMKQDLPRQTEGYFDRLI
jgi:hypothetical protein